LTPPASLTGRAAAATLAAAASGAATAAARLRLTLLRLRLVLFEPTRRQQRAHRRAFIGAGESQEPAA
jgi:hypothetical protein